MKGNTPLAFVICTERGDLERQSILLCESLRAYGGILSQAPILSYSPRAGHAPSSATIRKLERLSVTPIIKVLNRKYPAYPVSNKIFAGLDAQERSDAEIIVFLDSDMILLNEPSKLLLNSSLQFAAVPIWATDIGSTGPSDPSDACWKELYRLAGARRDIYTQPLFHPRHPVRAHWNAGVLAVRRSSNLFQHWLETFSKCWDSGLYSHFKRTTDEVSLAATIAARHPYRYKDLSPSYNYPLFCFKNEAIPTRLPIRSLDQVVIFHYSRLFRKEMRQLGMLFTRWFKKSDQNEKSRWLQQCCQRLL